MMPKKRILLWAEIDMEASWLAYVLRVHRYAVTKAETDAQFKRELTRREWDLVIIPNTISPTRTSNKEALVRKNGGYAVLILTWDPKYTAPKPHRAMVLPYGTSNAAILENVRSLVKHRPGPKPKGRNVLGAIREADYGFARCA